MIRNEKVKIDEKVLVNYTCHSISGYDSSATAGQVQLLCERYNSEQKCINTSAGAANRLLSQLSSTHDRVLSFVPDPCVAYMSVL